jgi:TrmH family RNA methyltransferase
MLSKNQVKFIRSLNVKKFRDKEGYFIAEGEKIVFELLNSQFKTHSVYHTSEWSQTKKQSGNFFEVSDAELKKISLLETPNKVIAIASIPKVIPELKKLADDLTLMLDDIQDPGNLGTILRTADWFGIKNIICSNETVDAFNPKVVQSSMGSLFRINIFYADLKEMLSKIKSELKLPIYGAFLNENNLSKEKLNIKSVLLIGNESKGISKQLEAYVNKKISIPSGSLQSAESLNAAVATSILCYEFRRQAV